MNIQSRLSKIVMCVSLFIGFFTLPAYAQVTLEEQIKITDIGLHFNGKKVGFGSLGTADSTTESYDYFFGRNISAHGDSVKRYKNYVFMTWYQGGKFNRHVMLTRYNTTTGAMATIKFPHKHTGFNGNPLIGESHNTIAVAISPIDGTVHMLYDMHAYSMTRPTGGLFADDYFRYSYTVAGAAEVPDSEFTLEQFVKDTSSVSEGVDDYKHLTMTGNLGDKRQFERLTYPTFFTNTDGTILLYMRKGGNNNGGYVFSRYDAQAKKWSKFTQFNVLNARNAGSDYNWGLYGSMKYVNGKLRVGFQQRSSDNNDKYQYQNGIYYAYSDHPDGADEWKDHTGKPFDIPLALSDKIKIFEPGDLISQTGKNQVYIVGGFDWTVTDNNDVHIISKVRTSDRTEQVNLHSYKPAGSEEFIHSTDFSGASNVYTSGNNVYIIGLENGFPFVEKATGGTNDFERVYEAKGGLQFDHGRVHIQDGKLYYYLMGRGAGNSLPLYLHIIDLDVDGQNSTPVVPKPRVTFPQPALNVQEGYETLSLKVEAISPIADKNIVSVALYANGVLIREDASSPYIWGHKNKPNELLGFSAGQTILRAVATDSDGVQGQATMRLNVGAQPKISVNFAQASITAPEGYDQLSFKVTVDNPTDTIVTGVKLYANDTFIREDKAAPYVWGHKNKPLELLYLPTGQNVFRAVATDTNGNEVEATMLFNVVSITPPVVSLTQDRVIKTVGYQSLSISATAEGSADIAGVQLYINDTFIREDTAAPYVWGHKNKPIEMVGLPVGSHIISAVATDVNGLETRTIIPFDVKPLVVSSDETQPENSAANVFDGDTSDESLWRPTADGKRLVVDLGESTIITGVKLWSAQNQQLRYQVFVGDYPDRSFNKVVNDTKVIKTQAILDGPQSATFEATGRYVKVMVHSLSDRSNEWIGVTELEVQTSN